MAVVGVGVRVRVRSSVVAGPTKLCTSPGSCLGTGKLGQLAGRRFTPPMMSLAWTRSRAVPDIHERAPFVTLGESKGFDS